MMLPYEVEDNGPRSKFMMPSKTFNARNGFNFVGLLPRHSKIFQATAKTIVYLETQLATIQKEPGVEL